MASKSKTVTDRKTLAPGGRGRLTRKHRTTGMNPCSCGCFGCDPMHPLPEKVIARRSAGKCMGCGKENSSCTCKRKEYRDEPFHFKSPEERAEKERRACVEKQVKANMAKYKVDMAKYKADLKKPRGIL